MQELNSNVQHHCLKLQSGGIIRFATLFEIVYLKSDRNYTRIILNDLTQYIMCKNLLNFETELGYLFIRCHKTYLVNYLYIKEINTRNRHILLNTGISIPFSKNKSKILEEKLKTKPNFNYQLKSNSILIE
jgi:DNA-binding LytR/AlgR family response regulator